MPFTKKLELSDGVKYEFTRLSVTPKDNPGIRDRALAYRDRNGGIEMQELGSQINRLLEDRKTHQIMMDGLQVISKEAETSGEIRLQAIGEMRQEAELARKTNEQLQKTELEMSRMAMENDGIAKELAIWALGREPNNIPQEEAELLLTSRESFEIANIIAGIDTEPNEPEKTAPDPTPAIEKSASGSEQSPSSLADGP